jgi:hypothetical protein
MFKDKIPQYLFECSAKSNLGELIFVTEEIDVESAASTIRYYYMNYVLEIQYSDDMNIVGEIDNETKIIRNINNNIISYDEYISDNNSYDSDLEYCISTTTSSNNETIIGFNNEYNNYIISNVV